MDIANEYMQPKYGEHWYMLEGVFAASKDNRTGEYVVARSMEDIGSTYFAKELDINDRNSNLIYCKQK